MARHRREIPKDAFVHVMHRGVRRRTIFHKPADYSAFVSLLHESVERYPLQLFTYCLMANHWHLVLKQASDVSVSTYMHWLTGTHVRRYHAHYDLVGYGHLYQDRYRSEWSDSLVSLVRMCRYVEANPITAKLVRSADQWPWSGLTVRQMGDPAGLLTPPPIVLPPDWIDYVNNPDREMPCKFELATA